MRCEHLAARVDEFDERVVECRLAISARPPQIDVVQGDAGPAEFRTAPLWGLGQRIFFLHDGRTSNLLDAIRSHAGEADSRFPASEANAVIKQFDGLPEESKQDILSFLRSL